jgi:hypothetical protein
MISILLKDNKNKVFQEMMFLRNETELLICDNIIKINKSGTEQLQIETFTDGIVEYWEERGYKRDNALYDKLILEYNQQNDKQLTRWK